MSISLLRPSIGALYRIRPLHPPSKPISRWLSALHNYPKQVSGHPHRLASRHPPSRAYSKLASNDNDASGLPPSKPKPTESPGGEDWGDLIVDEADTANRLEYLRDRLVLFDMTSNLWKCLGFDKTHHKQLAHLPRPEFISVLESPRVQASLQELIDFIKLPTAHPPTAEEITKLFHYAEKDPAWGKPFGGAIPRAHFGGLPIRRLFAKLDELSENEKTKTIAPKKRESTGGEEYSLDIPRNFENVLYFTTGLRGRPGNDDPVMDDWFSHTVEDWWDNTLHKQRYTKEITEACQAQLRKLGKTPKSKAGQDERNFTKEGKEKKKKRWSPKQSKYGSRR